MKRVGFYGVFAILLLVGFARALTPTAPTSVSTIQSLNGAVFSITGAFSLASFSATSFLPGVQTGPATPANCVWGATGSCSTATTVGDWTLQLTLILNTVPGTATSYTITLVSNAFSQTFLTFSVPTSATSGSNMGFLIDLRTNTLVSTTAITIIVS